MTWVGRSPARSLAVDCRPSTVSPPRLSPSDALQHPDSRPRQDSRLNAQPRTRTWSQQGASPSGTTRQIGQPPLTRFTFHATPTAGALRASSPFGPALGDPRTGLLSTQEAFLPIAGGARGPRTGLCVGFCVGRQTETDIARLTARPSPSPSDCHSPTNPIQ